MAHGSNSSGNGAAEAGDMQQMAMNQLSQGINAMANQQYKKGEETTTNVFGMDLDKGMVNLFTTFYTGFGKQINDYLSPRIYDSVIKFGPSVKKISGITLEGKNLNRTAAGAALAVTLGGFLWPDVSLLTGTIRKQFDDAAQVRKRLAPLLDDVYGSHSAGTFNSIRVTGTDKKPGNSVIVAHRRRMHKENSHATTNIVVTSFVKNLPNFFHARTTMQALHSGETLSAVTAQRETDLAVQYTEEVKNSAAYKNRKFSSEELQQRYLENEVALRIRKEKNTGDSTIGWFGGSAILTQFAQAYAKSSERRMQATRQPYSALDMITALDAQVQNNPGGVTRFALPTAPGENRGRELPIEQYVAEIFEQHMREMADFDPHYTEIRDALKSDLKTVTKPIAEAITRGELNPLMLVRLVGEGQVVKKQGHGLAGEDEVKTLLEKYTSKSHSFMVGDSKEYLEKRNFTLEHVKDALKGLDGEERMDFAATLPDNLLQHAGMNDKDLRSVQEHRAQKAHDYFLMYETMGVASKSDDELREAGLGSTEIKRLHKDEAMIRQGGVEALHKLKSGPTNADGVEHLVNDFAVPKIAGDKAYLGTLVAAGRSALENEAANDHDGEARGKIGHADKLKPKTRAEHANDNHGSAANDDDFNDEMSHAERLAAKRGHGHGHSQSYE